MECIECAKQKSNLINEKGILNEIIIIRLVLIVCLVLYHSFAPFSSWTPITTEFNAPYYWISKISYSFFLGSFVFISGYLYAHADLIKGPQPIGSIVKKKGSRLIIPSVIFSVLYLLIFGLKNGETLMHAIYSIIEGRGHMWFLPMLFWLFLGIELLKRIRVTSKLILLITFVLSSGVFMPLPLRINMALQYLIFFYLGYAVKSFSKYIDVMGGGKLLWFSLLVWVACFVCTEWIVLYSSYYSENGSLGKKIISIFIYYGRLIYTIAGTIFIYAFALKLIYRYKVNISGHMVKMSGLCFGIYLYQQFILIFLYYHTDFVDYTGVLAAPWFGFVITLILSTVLSYLTMQTRLGRALIG